MTKIATSFQVILPRCKPLHSKGGITPVHTTTPDKSFSSIYTGIVNRTLGTDLGKSKPNFKDAYLALYWAKTEECLVSEPLCCPKIKVPPTPLVIPPGVLDPCEINTSPTVNCGEGHIILYAGCTSINHDIPFTVLIAPTQGYLTRENNNIWYYPNVITTGDDTVSIQVTNVNGVSEIYTIDINLECTVVDDCLGVTMTYSDVPGGITYNNIIRNGQSVTDYLISWVNQNGVEVFQIGTGIYAMGHTLPGQMDFVPLPVGTYTPILLESTWGSNLDCFTPVVVNPIQCGEELNYAYEGNGGAFASQEFSWQITNNTRLMLELTAESNPDKVDFIYNGNVVYSTGYTSFNSLHAVDIAYVPGQSIVTVNISNTNPNAVTKYTVRLKCCTGIDCTFPTNEITALPAIYTDCNCIVDLISGGITTSEAYDNCVPVAGSRSTQVTGGICASEVDYTNTQFTCTDCTNTYVNVVGSVVTVNFSADCVGSYNILKAALLAATPTTSINTVFKESACVGDTPTFGLIFYGADTYTFDDINRIVTYTYSGTNPYPDTCASCSKQLRNSWDNSINEISFFTQNNTLVSVSAIAATTLVPAPVAESLFTTGFLTECGDNRRYFRISYRDTNCPCESWQIHEGFAPTFNYTTPYLIPPFTGCTI